MTAAILRATGWLPWRAALLPLGMVALALMFGLAVAVAYGKGAMAVLAAFGEGAFGSAYAVGASLNRATVFALVALGFCWAYRLRLVNVGGEGQIAIGGICATALALHGGASALPAPLCYLLPALAAAAGGALWGGTAGVLKVRFGANEVITSLLLGFVALWVLYAATHSEAWLRQPVTSSTSLPESLDVPPPTRLPLLHGASGSPLHQGLVWALGAVGLLWFLLERTVLGVRLRAIGLNERAAAHFGIRARLHLALAMAVAGGFAGLAGGCMILGDQFNLKAEFSSGYGFDGLVVGLLARGSPLAVLPYALLFGFLRSGGIAMEISAGVPSALMLALQGGLTVAVAAAQLGRREPA